MRASPASNQGGRALLVLCAGVLLIVLDATSVIVALPAIRQDLQLSEEALTWIINAYRLAFGGFLILSGRLGDLFGHRRVFLSGLALFAGGSLFCGFASAQWLMIGARSLQGIGGAALGAAALSLIGSLFEHDGARARAMGIYGLVFACGGSAGPLLGGALMSALSWHWIFWVNVPLGVAVFLLSRSCLPDVRPEIDRRRIDVWGAVTLTASMTLVIHALTLSNDLSWPPPPGIVTASAGGALCLALFLAIEARASQPLMPLSIFGYHNIVIVSIVRALWAAATSSWLFIAALYLQRVQGYDPLEMGSAFLPANIATAVFSLTVSPKLVVRFGPRITMVCGFLLGAAGLGLLARAPADGDVMFNMLPATILLGLGIGAALNPLYVVAMRAVGRTELGMVSGITNTATLLGGAIGLVILMNLATARTHKLLMTGASDPLALTGGYQAAFLLSAVFAAMAAVIAGAFLRDVRPRHTKVSRPSSVMRSPE